MTTFWRVAASVGLAGAAWLPTAESDQRVGLDQILEAVGQYVREYERSFSAVVSHEQYAQRVVAPGAPGGRELRSEVALVAVGDAEWLMFRECTRWTAGPCTTGGAGSRRCS